MALITDNHTETLVLYLDLTSRALNKHRNGHYQMYYLPALQLITTCMVMVPVVMESYTCHQEFNSY